MIVCGILILIFVVGLIVFLRNSAKIREQVGDYPHIEDKQ